MARSRPKESETVVLAQDFAAPLTTGFAGLAASAVGYPAPRGLSALAAMILIATLALAAGPAPAQTITIGQVTARVGQTTATLPITVDLPAAAAGLLLRLQYNPAVLDAPTVEAGDIVAPGHTVDLFSPEPGRVNLFIGGLSAALPFTAQSGVVARLRFPIEPYLGASFSDVTLTASGAPALPASGLVSASGANIAHTVTAGRVTVKRAADADTWMLY